MSTLAVTNTLMSVFVPIGIAGATIALVCALIAAVALARGAAGLAGGAIGIWIVGAMLSMSASFANLWTPVIVSLIGLGVALVLGTVARLVLAAASAPRERTSRERPTPARAPRAQNAGVRTGSVVTEGIHLTA